MSAKTILITGASGGIGAALARRYAHAGITLLLWGRDETRLMQTAAQCRALGAECITALFDIRVLDDMEERLVAQDAATPIDLAIFNAGLGGSVAKDDICETPQRARATAEVNFVAPVIGANVMAQAMAGRGGGQIVLVGSIAESFPLPMAPTYAATKAGLAMFAEALSIRMARQKVRVTLVSPGFVDTAMSRGVPEAKPKQAHKGPHSNGVARSPCKTIPRWRACGPARGAADAGWRAGALGHIIYIYSCLTKYS